MQQSMARDLSKELGLGPQRTQRNLAGGKTASATSSPITVSGLPNDTPTTSALGAAIRRIA